MKLTCPLEPAHGELRTAWHLFAHLLQDHNLPQAEAACVVTKPLDLRLDEIAAQAKRKKAKTAGPAPPPRTRAPGFYWSCAACRTNPGGPFKTEREAAAGGFAHRGAHPGSAHALHVEWVPAKEAMT